MACAIGVFATAINMTWTYWVAAHPGRGLVERLLKFLEIQLPKLTTSDAVWLVLFFRVTPGIPFFLHNFILGFLRVPFRIYLPLSVVLSGAFTVGFMLSAGAIFKGESGVAIVGISILAGAVAVTGLLRKRIGRAIPASRPNSEDELPAAPSTK